MDAFGSSRLRVNPPQRGVFALDHDHECRPQMSVYLACLKESEGDHIKCRLIAKDYLQW